MHEVHQPAPLTGNVLPPGTSPACPPWCVSSHRRGPHEHRAEVVIVPIAPGMPPGGDPELWPHLGIEVVQSGPTSRVSVAVFMSESGVEDLTPDQAEAAGRALLAAAETARQGVTR